jgi:hypothetical protein
MKHEQRERQRAHGQDDGGEHARGPEQAVAAKQVSQSVSRAFRLEEADEAELGYRSGCATMCAVARWLGRS